MKRTITPPLWLVWPARLLFTAAFAAVLCFVFSNSATPAEVSSASSQQVVETVQQTLNRAGLYELAARITEHVVRKTAHFLEFMLLGAVACCGLRAWFSRWSRHFGTMLFVLLAAALTDETIQLFSPGRSSQVSDVWLDFAGAVCGVVIGILGWCFLAAIAEMIAGLFQREKREKKEESAEPEKPEPGPARES